jgi:hypothetical protein
MVEVEDLLTKMEVVDEEGAAGADAQLILVIGDGAALGGRQSILAVLGELMEFTSGAAMKLLIVDGCCVTGRI